MKETENLNISLGSEEKKQNKKSSLKLNNPNLNDIIDFIHNIDITDSEKEKLIKAAKKVPHGALKNFRDNYKIYLRRKQ